MSATTWTATIRLPNGNQQEIRVMADSQQNAGRCLRPNTGGVLFGVHKVDSTRW